MLIDGDGDVPGAAEALGENDEIAGAELDGGGIRRGALDVGLHPALEEVARLLGLILEGELPRRTTPPSSLI